MKRLLLVPFLLVASVMPASSEGALATGIPEGGLRDGFAFGWRVGASDRATAETGAVEICREQARKYGVPPQRCSVVAAFKGRCVSVAFDGGDRWAGWAVGDTRELAVEGALKKCGEGAKNCKTFDTDCDR